MENLGIGTAARLTALSPFTIRAWETRHGILAPRRDSRGRRIYSRRDLRRLMLLAKATQRGYRVGEISGLSNQRLTSLLAAEAGAGAPDAAARARREILAAAEAYDVARLCAALDGAVRHLAPLEAVEGVLAPVLHEMGRLWCSGQVSIAQEHLLSSCVERIVLAELHSRSRQPSGPALIVGTLSGELHGLGALLVAYVASIVGHVVYLLGTDLPAQEFRRVVERSRAALAAVSVVTDESARRLPQQLEGICNGLQGGVRVVVGGRAAAQLRNGALPPSCTVTDSMDALIDLLLDD